MSAPRGLRRIGTVLLAYACVFVLYAAFFASPVSPAEPTDTFDFVIEDRRYSSLPYIHERVYTNGKAFLVIATVRTISAPNSAFSAAFERLDGYAESYAREQYGVEIDIVLEFRDESHEFAGHTGVKFVYSVNKNFTMGLPPFTTTQTVKLAELGALAWFCNVDFESIVMFYVTPFYFIEDPSLELLSSDLNSMVEDVACH